MKNKILQIAIGICLIATQKISAQWTVTTGPTQPNILSVSTSGSNTFAAAGTAVSLTANNGNNWTLVSNGLSGTIYSVATNGADVFAGASGGVVFQSSNNGTNWTNTSTGLPGFDVRSLTINGTDIYAATYGVYRTTNNGLLWSKLNQTWNASVLSIAVSGSTILAGTTTTGIYRSTDNGNTWSTINTGLPSQVNAVVIVGTTYLAGTNTGLYISTNSGSSWILTNVTDAIGSFTTFGNNVFAGSSSGGGVFLSTNSGTSWSAINNGLTNLTVYSLATNSTYIFAGTSGYVWKRPLVEVLPATYTIITSSLPSNGGTTAGNGSYISGNSVTVSATANNGFVFNNWTENGNIVSTNNTFSFTASSNRNLVANFSPTTSIIEQEKEAIENEIKIFPNPSKDFFNVAFEEKQNRILSLIDASGRTLRSYKVSDQQAQLSLEGLESGIYFLSIDGENKVVKRIVKE